MLAQELLALAVAEAEEHHVDLFERHLAGEPQVGVAIQALMHVGHKVACVALAVCKHNLCLRVVKQQSYQFAASITGSS